MKFINKNLCLTVKNRLKQYQTMTMGFILVKLHVHLGLTRVLIHKSVSLIYHTAESRVKLLFVIPVKMDHR